MEKEWIKWLFGAVMAIIAYFLKKEHDKVDNLSKEVRENTKAIEMNTQRDAIAIPNLRNEMDLKNRQLVEMYDMGISRVIEDIGDIKETVKTLVKEVHGLKVSFAKLQK